MTTQRTYSPKDVKISWGGWPIEGYADGTFVEASRNSPNSESTVGAAGDVGITFNADKTGNVTITLMQTSDTNVFLSAVQLAQDKAGEIYRADMAITDKSGTFLGYVKAAHIVEPASLSLGDAQSPKVWTFYTENLDYADTIPSIGVSAGLAARIKAGVSNLVGASKKVAESVA